MHVFVCVFTSLCVSDRDLGGEAVLRETIRGALSAQRERYCLPHRGLCHHAAGVWHAGGGQTHTHICLHCFHITHTHTDMLQKSLKGNLSLLKETNNP